MSETIEPTDEEIEAEVAKTEAAVLEAGFNLAGEQLTWLRLGARNTAYRLLSERPSPLYRYSGGDEAVSDWQDIDTAPKDGTFILAFNADTEWPNTEERYALVQWEPRGYWRIALDGQTFRPTHWQPLPEPPSIQAETEK